MSNEPKTLRQITIERLQTALAHPSDVILFQWLEADLMADIADLEAENASLKTQVDDLTKNVASLVERETQPPSCTAMEEVEKQIRETLVTKAIQMGNPNAERFGVINTTFVQPDDATKLLDEFRSPAAEHTTAVGKVVEESKAPVAVPPTVMIGADLCTQIATRLIDNMSGGAIRLELPDVTADAIVNVRKHMDATVPHWKTIKGERARTSALATIADTWKAIPA